MVNQDTIISTGKFIAQIDESRCIGCALCIKACPFDAIIGSTKNMHTILTPYCTGCKLCLAPCPVDCISMKNNTYFESVKNNLSMHEISTIKKSFATFTRENTKIRNERLDKQKKEKQKLFEIRKKQLLNR